MDMSGALLRHNMLKGICYNTEGHRSSPTSSSDDSVPFPMCTCGHFQSHHQRDRCITKHCSCTKVTPWINPKTGITYSDPHPCRCGHGMNVYYYDGEMNIRGNCKPLFGHGRNCSCTGFIPQ